MKLKEIEHIKNNPSFTLQIISQIESEIKRSINRCEENLVVAAVKNLPSNYFSNYSITRIITIIKNAVITEIAEDHCAINNVDIHEILKHNINPDKKDGNSYKDGKRKENIVETNVESIFGYTDIATLVKKVNEPISSVNNIYILLDTRYRTLDNDGTTYFSWGHMNQLTIAQGTVNSLGNIRDIISLIMMPIKIPNVLSNSNYYDLITISIEEFIPQSIIAHEDRRFHFMSCVDRSKSTDKWLLLCSDDYHKGEYKFNKPITSLDTITIKFGTPLEPLIFDKDRLRGAFTYGNPTIIEFTENHKLIIVDNVYIDQFESKNPVYTSNIINAINKKTGHTATVVSPTSISIPVDSSSIRTTISGTVSTPSILLPGTISVNNTSNVITGVGTSFITDFVVGDYIQILNGTTSPLFQIQIIHSNTQITINTAYQNVPGNYPYRKSGLVITGTGTLFTSELYTGDNIIINTGNTPSNYTVKSIQSDTSLILDTPYNGIDGSGFIITKDNSILESWSVFFGSKRIFIPMELTYLSS